MSRQDTEEDPSLPKATVYGKADLKATVAHRGKLISSFDLFFLIHKSVMYMLCTT